jgi:hypothetical protein
MARKKRVADGPKVVGGCKWGGVFEAGSPGSWIKRELELEQMPEEAFAPAGAQPVSARVEVETLALLDAFAERFKTSRSGVLLELIRGGLADAFRALPEDEKAKIAKAARAKAPGAMGLMPFTVTQSPLPPGSERE